MHASITTSSAVVSEAFFFIKLQNMKFESLCMEAIGKAA